MIAVLGSLGGCEQPEPPQTAAPAPDSPGAFMNAPTEPPDIQGIVSSTDSGTILIETNPLDESGSPKAMVRLTPETAVMYRGGDAASRGELTIGHNVSAWFQGPAMESYPLQATGATIVIEPAGPP
ncbi:MAG: hypothetical protein WD737_01630 [Gemmatimonadota bacterium]